MLGYCPPPTEPPTLRRQIGIPFHPPGSYYLPQPQCPIESSPSPPQVAADLENKELWQKFSSVGTEMILTKSGRRMFPEFVVSVSGLEPHCLYTLCVQAVPKGETRYKWRDGAWSMSGRSEPGPPTRLYMHPESPAPGHRWMDRPISFSKIRLTNNTLSHNGQIVLQSMHRYFLRLYIVPTSCYAAHSHAVSDVSFPETSFIAVTSYQNPQLSLLKIEENPFAKGIKYFKNHQESRAPNKRSLCSLEEGDDSKGSKQLKESDRDCETVSDAMAENRLDSRHHTQATQKDSGDILQERQDSGDCSQGRQQESGDRMQERRRESGDRIVARQFVCREGTQKRHLYSEDDRQTALRDCKREREEATEDREQGRDSTDVTVSATHRRLIDFAKNLGDTRDITLGTALSLENDKRSSGPDMTAHCGPRTHSQPWLSPSAVSSMPTPPYSPSHSVMAQRLSFSFHPTFPSYSSATSRMPSTSHSSPIPMSLWTPTPITLSSNFPALQPPVFQEMIPPPWYMPQHPICRGL